MRPGDGRVSLEGEKARVRKIYSNNDTSSAKTDKKHGIKPKTDKQDARSDDTKSDSGHPDWR